MVKGLLIVNVGVYLIGTFTQSSSFNINTLIALYPIDSEYFYPYQFFTYMFGHSLRGWGHILFNMIGLIVFGGFLENFWGSNRFLVFYLGTGIGAAVIYASINFIGSQSFESKVTDYQLNPSPEAFTKIILDESRIAYRQWYEFIESYEENPNNPRYIAESKEMLRALAMQKSRSSMVGASGAIYGLLMACALLFPNMTIMLLIPPIPVKMKWLALILGGIAVYSSFERSPGDNVAHLAHLGGMVFAYIMIMFWRKSGTDYR